MEWMILPLKRYATFSGRSRRKEYWMFVLFTAIGSVVLTMLDDLLGLGGDMTAGTSTTATGVAGAVNASGGWLSGLFSLAMLVPSVAVTARRLHDTDRSGWWMLLPLLPYGLGVALALTAAPFVGIGVMLLGVVAALWLFVALCRDGTPGPNRFGADPKDPHGMNVEDVFA